ncbi:MBOAT family protein [soil metagenome]
MTFNSIEFAALLGAVLALHWTVAPRWRNAVILAGSYVFYGWWDVRLLSLLVFSTAVDFAVARRLGATSADDRTTRQRLIGVSLVANLGVLVGFKYAGFFVASLTSAMTSLGLSANPTLLQVVLPIGISFYTFQSMAYTIDVYRGRIRPTRDPVLFATYIAYFPQLVAGPIERAERLLPQMQDPGRRFPTGPALERSLSLIGLGLVQKVVLADTVAPIVNDVFDRPGEHSWVALLAGLVGFSVQIYGDFAGYTNIARGVSSLFGIQLMTNFTEPYLSRDITEFWRRWHISLSTWLRDYLYIPLGGNRGGGRRTVRNLMITMLLGGLWHGASTTFLVWGGLHGLFLAIHRGVRGNRPSPPDDAPVRVADIPRITLTFGLVALAWTFFRADTVGGALTVLNRIATLQSGRSSVADVVTVAVLAGAMVALDLLMRRQSARPDRPLITGPVRTGVVGGVAVVLVLVAAGGTPEPFVYFQF